MTEQLLQYTWKHRLFPTPLLTTRGKRLEVLDPGLWNHDSGPDFFNAKIIIDGQEWVGNVEVHLKSSDWLRHGHQEDRAYDNVVLHVVGEADCDVSLASGRVLPQAVIAAPQEVAESFSALMAQEAYPPCYRIIPHVAQIKVHAWLSALTVERLQQKTERIDRWLQQTGGDWERTFFIALARGLGFGINSDAFELWAAAIDLSQVGKHRDNLEQVEAFFLGTAGLLPRALKAAEGKAEPSTAGPSSSTTAHLASTAALWQREWKFLQSKFGLAPMPPEQWRYLRLRPQNFPHVRLLQLARLYHEAHLALSPLLQAPDADAVRQLFATALPQLQKASITLLLVNVAAPILFAHGRSHRDDERTERAFALLESLPAENNNITRSWRLASLTVASAADSQALLQLRHAYCDRRDCLRCRFGAEYLAQKPTSSNL